MKEFGLTPDLFREVRRAGQYSIERVFHHLVKEPFNVAYSDLQDLSPVAVKHVYFRDEEADRQGTRQLPPGLRHRLDCQAKGMTEEEIQRTWQERISSDPALRELHTP